MAEAAALALAAAVVSALNIQCPVLLADNQQQVSYFNSRDHSTPPRWDIKH